LAQTIRTAEGQISILRANFIKANDFLTVQMHATDAAFRGTKAGFHGLISIFHRAAEGSGAFSRRIKLIAGFRRGHLTGP